MLGAAFSRVSPCFAYHGQRASETDAAYVARLAAELEAEFQRLGPDTVAAFMAETVVGATAGCVAALPGYFAAVRAICDRHGALLILDEVMCGMGRTGTLHAWEQEGVAPDLQIVAKGLGGGYQPIGGVLIGRRIVDAIRAGSGAFVHGHTYQAHPVACAAALAVQRIIRDDRLVAHVAAMGDRLGDKAIHGPTRCKRCCVAPNGDAGDLVAESGGHPSCGAMDLLRRGGSSQRRRSEGTRRPATRDGPCQTGRCLRSLVRFVLARHLQIPSFA